MGADPSSKSRQGQRRVGAFLQKAVSSDLVCAPADAKAAVSRDLGIEFLSVRSAQRTILRRVRWSLVFLTNHTRCFGGSVRGAQQLAGFKLCIIQFPHYEFQLFTET